MSGRLCIIGLVASLAVTLAGCTPTRSKLPPPYRIDGRELSAPEMQEYAQDRCALAANTTSGPPPHPFTTDGCSVYRDSVWQGCCLKHDVEYWCGSTPRRLADLEFRQCVSDASSAGNANLMYAAVRLGGGRFVPFPWRYGYGWKWPHRKPVDSEATRKTPPTAP